MIFDPHLSDNLATYFDGSLSPKGRLRAEAHLSKCSRCRSELEEYEIGVAALRFLPFAEAPPGLWASIEAELQQQRPERRTLRWALALAAVFIAAIGSLWMLNRPGPAEWEVVEGGVRWAADGEWVVTAERAARIRIGEIGIVDVQPDSRVQLLSTGAQAHRLALAHGEIFAKITAPPRLFFVETAAGTAVDLGCEYLLRCDRDGEGKLQVTAGWVGYEWQRRESLVPAGASCRTSPNRGPGLPYFDDASANLIRGVEDFDAGRNVPAAVAAILAEARLRDTLTLWHLLSRVDAAVRARVYERIAALAPPPADVSRSAIEALESNALRRWREELAWLW